MSALQLVWNDVVLGVLPDPRIDNFFLYGRFVREASPDTWSQLLDRLRSEGDVRVELRGRGRPMRAWLIAEPDDDDEIEVRLDPSPATALDP